MGEVGGRRPAGFDLGNSPTLLAASDVRGRALIQRTSAGAQGLMQVIPSTWNWIAELLREPPADPWDVEANVRYGVHYLRWLKDYHDGDYELVVENAKVVVDTRNACARVGIKSENVIKA
jgi:hypothetical protein